MQKFSSYDEVINFLFEQLPMYQRIGPMALKYDLSNITRMMDSLGNPERKFKSIHIAGTNGKGSTAHLISAVFQANGYKTGLYTSPHYKDFRERIKIDGKMIDQQYMVNFMNNHFMVIRQCKPSYFELSVALAFQFFGDNKVDIAVIEVGLGGRLDSTNIITPMLSVITNISLDHTQTLGSTIPEIAIEKAGIIKINTPVLIGEKQVATTPVYKKIAGEKKADLYFAEDIISKKDLPASLKKEFHGPFYYKNLRTSLAAIRVFQTHYPGFKLSSKLIFKGLEDVEKISSYAGRWMVLGTRPLIIADGAHNHGSWKKTSRHLLQMKHSKLHMIVGFVFDKEIDDILRLLPVEAQYYFCQASIPRALNSEELRQKAYVFGLNGNAFSTVKEALSAAKEMANPDDLIFVGGSIFVVGEII